MDWAGFDISNFLDFFLDSVCSVQFADHGLGTDKVGGSIDTERKGVNEPCADRHTASKARNCSRPNSRSRAEGPSPDKFSQRPAAIGVDADVVVRRAAQQSDGTSEINRQAHWIAVLKPNVGLYHMGIQ